MADVCGFGPLFQGVASRFREIMKQNVNTIKQARSVRQMSEQLTEAAQYGGFASTLMSTYFAPTRSFTACNAGHPSPMLYRHGMRKWSLLKQPARQNLESSGTVGVMCATEYQQFKTKLAVGDMVLTCSNSLTETRSHFGQTIGLDALLSRVQQLDCDSPHELPQRLLDNIVHEQTENLCNVDVTIMLCRATETRVDWRDNVLAPFRLLRSVTDRTSFV